MSTNPYDYSTRRGVRPLSWDEMHGLCKALVAAVAPFGPQIILPVGRGGYYPGTLIAHMLQVEVYPIRLSRRVNDTVLYESPQWRLEPPALVCDQRVLVVDEMCGSGETLRMVLARLAELGVSAARTAVLFAHTWGVELPDYIGFVSDALVVNPWDREIFRDGRWQWAPEYRNAFALQGLVPGDYLLIGAAVPALAKG
jgi:hypoxanthine phosphoribosyltransferase